MDDGGFGLGIEFLLAPFALVLLIALAILLIVPLVIAAWLGIARRIHGEVDAPVAAPVGNALGELFGHDSEPQHAAVSSDLASASGSREHDAPGENGRLPS